MIREKNIVVAIILSFVTCGIYAIIWFINMTDDMRYASGDQTLEGGKEFLLTLLTCGIYGYYWAYKMGKAQVQAQAKHGIPTSDNSVLYIILQFFGLAIVNYCLIQSELNKMATPNQSNQNMGV
ncbi:MAG: DUF4234 domain-containing protein [bacterium]|nr:DUF4234 domain-containing protein [bacterium]